MSRFRSRFHLWLVLHGSKRMRQRYVAARVFTPAEIRQAFGIDE